MMLRSKPPPKKRRAPTTGAHRQQQHDQRHPITCRLACLTSRLFWWTS
jgi:hypothetical protein